IPSPVLVPSPVTGLLRPLRPHLRQRPRLQQPRQPKLQRPLRKLQPRQLQPPPPRLEQLRSTGSAVVLVILARRFAWPEPLALSPTTITLSVFSRLLSFRLGWVHISQ
ncbi:hypothetical protein FRC12_024429, partial [Ceratobasidium sp. 428]